MTTRTVVVPAGWSASRVGMLLLGLGILIWGILALTGQANPFPPVIEGLWACFTGGLLFIGWLLGV